MFVCLRVDFRRVRDHIQTHTQRVGLVYTRNFLNKRYTRRATNMCYNKAAAAAARNAPTLSRSFRPQLLFLVVVVVVRLLPLPLVPPTLPLPPQ